MDSLLKDHCEIIKVAQEHLQRKDNLHMNSTTNASPPVYEINSLVLAEHRGTMLRTGPNSKMKPFLKGPMRVISRNDAEGMYVLQDLITQRSADYHVSLIHPFRSDERTLTPMQTAVTDYLDEFVVESILAHKGNLRAPRKHLVFLVKWAGYDDPAENTWEPYDNIKDNAFFKIIFVHILTLVSEQ